MSYFDDIINRCFSLCASMQKKRKIRFLALLSKPLIFHLTGFTYVKCGQK